MGGCRFWREIRALFQVGSGIPEMKAIMSGYWLSRYLSPHAFIAKVRTSNFYAGGRNARFHALLTEAN
eukprot:2623044-Pleurochrysis_carterae.AAC.1